MSSKNDARIDQEFDILEKGIRFECQGSGKCCLSRGEYGYVYLTDKDRMRMAKLLKMKQAAFTKKYCQKTEGYYHLRADSKETECMFLSGNKCDIYKARPTQCRTWPFWPEVMNSKSWNKDVKSFCPGIGKGRYYSPSEIRNILNWQIRAESK